MSSTDKIEERWFEFIEAGVLVVEGVDTDGQIMYVVDPDTLQRVDPELYEEYMLEIDEALLGLFSKGLIDMEFTEEGVDYTLSEKGREWRDLFDEAEQ